jgi:hypothetical protein
MPKSKSGSGNKKRKTGDWIAIANGRKNKALEVVHRGNRDYPQTGTTGSAAYRRMTGQR